MNFPIYFMFVTSLYILNPELIGKKIEYDQINNKKKLGRFRVMLMLWPLATSL